MKKSPLFINQEFPIRKGDIKIADSDLKTSRISDEFEF